MNERQAALVGSGQRRWQEERTQDATEPANGAGAHEALRTGLLIDNFVLLRVVLDRYRQSIASSAESHGLTELQARCLGFLFESGPTAMRDLAAFLENDPASVTSLVDRLEQRILVERRSDPADRRVKLIALTDTGIDACRHLRDDFAVASPAHVLDSAELRQLRDLLIKLVGSPPDYRVWQGTCQADDRSATTDQPSAGT